MSIKIPGIGMLWGRNVGEERMVVLLGQGPAFRPARGGADVRSDECHPLKKYVE
jgi:hypothetical protein